MKKTSLSTSVSASAVLKIGLLLIMAISVPAALWADKWDDLHKKAETEAGNGQFEAAKNDYCAAADGNPKDANWATDCRSMTAQLGREIAKADRAFKAGVDMFNADKLDEAKVQFDNIALGPHLDDAKNYIEKLIPQQKQKDTDLAKQKDDAVKAAAAAQAAQAAAAAQALQQKQADLQKQADQQKQADLQRQQSDQQKQREDTVKKQQEDANAKQQQQQDLAKRQQLAQQIAPLKSGAEQAIKRNDLKTAEDQVAEIEKLEAGNADARALQHTIDLAKVALNQDGFLGDAIKEFYMGDLQDLSKAEAKLEVYLTSQTASRPGLANFFLGATKISEAFLQDPKSDKGAGLVKDANGDFLKAKKVAGFVPPEKAVSPKILDAFKNAS